MLRLYILTDGKNYVMDDPIHPGRVMYSTSPVNAKKFTFKQARALLNNKSKKLSWIRSFNMVDDSSGEEIAEQEIRSRSNKGVFVGKNDIDFDVSILDQIMQETNNLLGIAGWNMAQLTTYQNMLSTALSKYDSAEADIEHALQTYKEESGGKKPQAHKMAKVGYLLDDVRDKHKRIKQCQCYIKVISRNYLLVSVTESEYIAQIKLSQKYMIVLINRIILQFLINVLFVVKKLKL